MTAPPPVKVPTISWAQAVRLVPADILNQLVSAWSGSGSGVGSLSSQQWLNLMAASQVFDSVPQLESALRNAWMAGGAAAPSRSRAATGIRMPTLAKPPTIRQPRQRFNFR